MAWQMDSAHSEVQFAVRHMMISRVRGQFEKFGGSVNFDEDSPANTTVDIQIDAASINTREEQRDGHLKSADFLDVENYPHITFKSTNVERVGSSSAKLHGDLTIRDITKPIVLDVNYEGRAKSPWGAESVGFTANTKINRTDWELTWNQALETGGFLVGDDVNITIELELVNS